MKFEYNNKIYCVFASRKEIDTKGHLIKINEDYCLPNFDVKTDSLGKTYHVIHSSKYTKLNTTQVLSHTINGSSILIAYEVNRSKTKELIKLSYDIPVSIDSNELIAYITEYKHIKDKVLINFKDTYTAILLTQEETEEEVKERVTKSIGCNCNSEVDKKIKYFYNHN